MKSLICVIRNVGWSLVMLLLPLVVRAERLVPPEQIPERIPHFCSSDSCSARAIELRSDYDRLTGFTPRTVDDTFSGECEMVGRSVFGAQAFTLVQLNSLHRQFYLDGRFSGPVTDIDGSPNLPSWSDQSAAEIKTQNHDNVGNETWMFFTRRAPDGRAYTFVDSRTKVHDSDFIMWLRSTEDGDRVIALGYFSLTSQFICDLHRLK